jgi:hypothetical protein
LRSPAKEVWVGADDQRVDVKLLKSRERLVDLAFIAGVDDLDLMADALSGPRATANTSTLQSGGERESAAAIPRLAESHSSLPND